MTDRVAIVGAGRAGRGLARALRACGVPVVALVSRRAAPPDDPDHPVRGALGEVATGATIVVVAVQDAALAGALDEIVAARLPSDLAVLQMSGSAPDSALDTVRARGHAAATFHPLVPLSDPDLAAAAFASGWVGTGGDPAAVAAGARLAAALGARTLALPPEDRDRAVYHAAAVVASNFPVALAALAERLVVAAGVDAASGREAVCQLMQSAVDNLRGRAPADALTGPIARGDSATVGRHLDALATDRAALTVYRSLSLFTVQVVATRLAAGPARALENALGARSPTPEG